MTMAHFDRTYCARLSQKSCLMSVLSNFCSISLLSICLQKYLLESRRFLIKILFSNVIIFPIRCINTGKCELIANRDYVVDDQMLQCFIRVDIGDASLLGAPLFTGTLLDNAWLACCDDLARGADRLCKINAQDALILLRSSFSALKVLH